MTAKKASLAFDKRRQSRRDEIVEAAIMCFAEQGYEGTTLQDIADRMGLTHAALYYYYKSKEVLLVRSADSILRGLVAAIHGSDPGAEAAQSDRLKSLIVTQILYQFETREITPFIDSVLFGAHSKRAIISEEYLEELRDVQRDVARAYKDVLAEGIRRGEFRIDNLNAVVFAIIGVVSHTVYWYTPRHSDDLASFANDQAEICLKMCR